MKTLLGTEETQDEKEKRLKQIKKNTWQWRCAELVSEETIQAYKKGEIKDFKDAVGYILNSYNLVENGFVYIDEGETELIRTSEYISHHIKVVYGIKPKIRTRGSKRSPSWINVAVIKLIKLAHKNGYKLSEPENENSVFYKIEKVFKNIGITIPRSTIKSMYSNQNKTNRINSK